MVTRADKFTQLQKKAEYYSDFLNDFTRHPISNSLAKVTNEESVKQSLRNLILTSVGERMFEPNVGSNIYKALFEPNDVVTAENIMYYIKNTVAYNEPRVNLLDVQVYSNPDGNTFNVMIVFSLINNSNPVTLELILKRVR